MSVFNTPDSFECIPHENCSVCMDPLRPPGKALVLSNFTAEVSDGEAVGETPHTFHIGCLTPWVDSHPTCPLCRTDVTSVNGVPVAHAPEIDDDEEESRAPPVCTIMKMIVGTAVKSLLQVAATAATAGFLAYRLYNFLNPVVSPF